jgi:hypothetical protein
MESVVHRRSRKYALQAASALLCAVAIFAAGCHGNPDNSEYGIAWVTVTDQPGDFSSYIVTIDSVTLTRNDGIVVTAASAPEIVDLTQVSNIAEMWGSTAIPNGTYLSATIALDYTSIAAGGSSLITVLVDGVPKAVTVLDAATDLTPTTYSVTVTFDPNNPLVITPTYASTSAQRLAIEVNLAASGFVTMSAGAATLHVRPFLTAGVQAADNKLIRVRGPLINSSTDVDTYTVYIRPFYDEANNLGTLTLFNQPNTVYTINGKAYVGVQGLDALSVLSAGTTMTAGYTTFEPTINPANAATAGKFNLVYVVGASTLEDEYTEGMSGDVVARTDNTVTLLASTLFLNTADTFDFCVVGSAICLAPKTQVLLGPGTIVTADDNATLTGLNSDSIAVGQHITVRGIYSILADGTTQIDSRGSTTNTGSVRLQSTEVWGPLVSSAAGSLVMNAQTIDNLPVSDFTFTGNGAAAVNPAAFEVDTGPLALPTGTAAGDPVWADGFFTPFGSAPPDFIAVALNNELSVQTAGGPVGGGGPTTPGIQTCGIGSEVCEPASLQVVWSVPTGSVTPFVSLSEAGFAIDLAAKGFYSGVIRIGPESIDLTSLPASPQVVPTALPVTSTFAPQFTVGNPSTASVTATLATATTTLHVYNIFADFVAEVNSTLTKSSPAVQLEAHGVYNRTTNIFTATSVNLVL